MNSFGNYSSRENIFNFMYIVYILGQEKMPNVETDSDSGKGTMTSYGSVNSLNTNDGSQTASTPMDNPEQFETQKQQKEIMETGIDMWVIILGLCLGSQSYNLNLGWIICWNPPK